MLNSKNEKIIVKIIKYGPVTLILLLSLILSFSLYINNQAVYNNEKKLIESEHIQRNKQLIKNQVDSVYNYIAKEQKSTETKLKESLKQRVYEAHTIATNIYNENKHLDKKIVMKMIKDALRNIRFNNKRGYFFIYSFDYECILLPVAKHLEGKSFYNFKDGKGNFLTRDIVEQVKKEKEGFLTWWYHKPSDMKNQYKKLGFNKHFEPYNWFIGTGEYIEDFENDIKKDILDYIQNLSYPNKEYIFVIDFNGKYLSHIRKSIIGLNALEAKDTRSHQTILDAIEISRNNGKGYISYVQTRKPGLDLPIIKTSYVRGFEKWQWFIGKGFYEDDIKDVVLRKKELLEDKFKENLKQIAIITIGLTTLLLFVSMQVSTLLQKRFKAYQNEIKSNLEKITQQHDMIAHQSKMAAIGNMIANIAHQWRQPLSMISTAATGIKLKKDLNILEDEDLYKSIEYINDSTQYLSKTIDDFRNFFSKNKEKEEFCIIEPINVSLNILKSQFKNNGIEIINTIGDSKIYGLKNELVQVIINIITNSKDEFIKKEKLRKLILIDSFEKEGFVYITIKDTAGGIDEKIIEHIFEPYFTTKHQSQGTGIGLYMTEEIITKHMKGTININNSNFDFEGKNYTGAKVTIKLKLA